MLNEGSCAKLSKRNSLIFSEVYIWISRGSRCSLRAIMNEEFYFASPLFLHAAVTAELYFS